MKEGSEGRSAARTEGPVAEGGVRREAERTPGPAAAVAEERRARTTGSTDARPGIHGDPVGQALRSGPRLTAQRRRIEEAYGSDGLRSRPGPVPEEAEPDRLPAPLHAGIQSLSGLDLSDVRVHRDSGRPEAMRAQAYAQGSEIHLAPGQERHLPHEAWHVVQQRQGRVRPTMEVGGVPVNDEPSLEREADQMGARAARHRADDRTGVEDSTRQTRRERIRSAIGSGRGVRQPFWELTADGKVVWKDGAAPLGYIETGQTKKSAPVFQAPAARADAEARQAEEARAQREALEAEAAMRAHPPTRRRDFAHEERERLARLPLLTTREDDTPWSASGWGKRKKAHLADGGLHTAGAAPISAAEQQDQHSVRKGRGNRVSSKAPLVSRGPDGSQSYGKQTIGIKAQKLERARLRGKPDAQHVTVRDTGEIVSELRRGPAKTESGKTRGALEGFALKDREFHHVVDFHSPDDPRHYIPNRFLVLPDGSQEHDSDSDEESDVEADLVEDLEGRGVEEGGEEKSPEEERKEEVEVRAPAPVSASASGVVPSGPVPSGAGPGKKGRGKRRKPKEKKPKDRK